MRYVVIAYDPAQELTDTYYVIAADRGKARDFVRKVRPTSDVVLVVDEEMVAIWLVVLIDTLPSICHNSMRQAVKRQFGDVRERDETWTLEGGNRITFRHDTMGSKYEAGPCEREKD